MKKRVYFDLDGVLADWKDVEHFTKEQRMEQGFFLNLPLMKGAEECFKILYKWFDVYFLSTAPWSNPYANTEKRLWVEKHFGECAFKRLILTHHKNLLIGDFLIDDRIANGVDGFQGEHLHFGTERFPDLESITYYLLNQI